MNLKKIIIISIAFLIIIAKPSYSRAANECFEGLSRGVFKFNLMFDDIVLEPVAKGYSRLPDVIKNSTGNFTSNILSIVFTRRAADRECPPRARNSSSLVIAPNGKANIPSHAINKAYSTVSRLASSGIFMY